MYVEGCQVNHFKGRNEMNDKGFCIAGEENVRNARILTLRSALKLELKGLKMSRGISAYAIIKREFGFKGNKARVLEQLNAFIDENVMAVGDIT